MKPSELSLKKNIAWNSSGSFVYLFFQWLISYLVVILLGFKDTGIFSLAVAISSVAFTFGLYGIRGYQVSDTAKKYSDKTYIVVRIVTCLLAIGGCLIYLTFHTYSLYTTMCIVAYLIFKLSEAYVDVYHGIIQKGLRMDFIGKSFILRGVISNLLFIGCAILTRNLLLSIIVLAISSFILIFLYDHNKVKLFYEKSNITSTNEIRNLLVECFPLAVYTFLSILVMSIPRVSLENIRGTEILGIYASIAIPAVIIQVVSGYIFAPMLTVFADHVTKKNFNLFHGLLFKTLAYILILSVVVIIGGAILGNFGLVLLFGEKISKYTYLFLPILFISSLTALSWFIGLMLTVIREFRGLIISSTIASAICFFGSRYFIDHFGINGASFILITALVLQIGIMSAFMAMKLARLRRA
ncbi:MAG: oligosaccharide flippase family protein [Candidatus Saccharimonadales bacterium]